MPHLEPQFTPAPLVTSAVEVGKADLISTMQSEDPSALAFLSGQAPEELTTALNKFYEFVYLAEGRANVVFAIHEKAGGGESASPLPQGIFKETLLRVPKVTGGVTPCDYETLQVFHDGTVVPQVGHAHVIPQVLVQISTEVAETLDDSWRRNSKKGAPADSRIQAGSAMLIQDMSASSEYLSLEFKPKWLAQSPMAPADAKRCRTCAREAFRNAQKLADGKTKTVSPPTCPLGLLHRERWVRMATIDRLAPEWSERHRERLADTFEKTGLLERLRTLQTVGDPDQGLFQNPSDPKFGLAMTLRDCSCFVRMPKDESKPVDIKLADVDKKNWKEKQTYWQESHNNLVDNGWYTGEEAQPIETACILELDRRLASDDSPGDLHEAFLARMPKD